jgi:hypothetical protein
MPRTWSNIKYKETRSAAQKIKNRPSSLTLFVFLIIFNLVLFGGLIAYTMNTVLHHPITEIPNLAHPPKDE